MVKPFCVHGCSLDPQVVDSIKYKLLESPSPPSSALAKLWIVVGVSRILVSRAPLQASSPSSWRDGCVK